MFLATCTCIYTVSLHLQQHRIWIAFEAATWKPAKRALTQISRLKFVVSHVPSQSLGDLFKNFRLSSDLERTDFSNPLLYTVPRIRG